MSSVQRLFFATVQWWLLQKDGECRSDLREIVSRWSWLWIWWWAPGLWEKSSPDFELFRPLSWLSDFTAAAKWSWEPSKKSACDEICSGQRWFKFWGLLLVWGQSGWYRPAKVDKAPRRSISILIWILSSETICQLNHLFSNSEAAMLSSPIQLLSYQMVWREGQIWYSREINPCGPPAEEYLSAEWYSSVAGPWGGGTIGGVAVLCGWSVRWWQYGAVLFGWSVAKCMVLPTLVSVLTIILHWQTCYAIMMFNWPSCDWSS